MNPIDTLSTRPATRRSPWRDTLQACTRVATIAVVLALVGVACGGGGVGTGGTGSFAQGAITGFGSIIVNGIHFDDSAARIEDDDGSGLGQAALRLGMVVRIQAGPLTSSGALASARADLVRIDRALVGPPTQVDAAAGRFTVLGHVVVVGADCVVDDRLVGGLAGLAQVGRVEVYGFFDPVSGHLAATRVGPAAAHAAIRVAGPVSRIDSAARTLQIGSQRYSFGSLGSLSGLSEGATLRLNLQGGTDAGGRWLVVGQGSAGPEPTEASQVELRGLVQSLASATRFRVDGVSVDAASARIDGQPVAGARVKVSGTLLAGVLVASRVSVEGSGPSQPFELKGAITAVDSARRRFVLRETTVSYAHADVEFKDGSAADLVVGRKVEVEGRLGADRSVLEATRIRFDR